MGDSNEETSPFVVQISGESLSLQSAPGLESSLVQECKQEIFNGLGPDEFAENIESVVHLMGVAFGSAVELHESEVSISIQDIGFRLARLTEDAHGVMHDFAVTSSGTVSDLENVFCELLTENGIDKVALTMLECIESRASEMKSRAMDMSRDFEGIATVTKAVLELTQRACANRRDELRELANEEVESEEFLANASTTHKLLTRSVADAELALRDARSREWWASCRVYWVSFFDDMTKIVQPILGLESQFRESVSRVNRDAKLARKAADRANTDRLVQVQRKSKAMHDIVHLVHKIRSARSKGEIAAVLIEALHKAAGALKRLSAHMLKTATMWGQLERQATRLGSPDEIGHLVRTACSTFAHDDEKRNEFWQSTVFKRRAVTYVSRWVATSIVCTDYTEQMQLTRKALYDFLMANPEYKQMLQPCAAKRRT